MSLQGHRTFPSYGLTIISCHHLALSGVGFCSLVFVDGDGAWIDRVVTKEMLKASKSNDTHPRFMGNGLQSQKGCAIFERTFICPAELSYHDDIIKWKHFPRYWPFVRGIHRFPVNSPHKGQWRGALMFSLICARINDWVNNREAGDLRRHRAHYYVTVMIF